MAVQKAFKQMGGQIGSRVLSKIVADASGVVAKLRFR
jgi:hypothetical protein